MSDAPSKEIVTDKIWMAAITAVSEEIYRQYRANPKWEDAKDVVENCSDRKIAEAVLTAVAPLFAERYAEIAILESERKGHIAAQALLDFAAMIRATKGTTHA